MKDVEKLWKEYHAALRRFIQRRIGDESTADDILQDVFLKTHSRIGTLKDERRIQGWLYQITRNTIIDYYRSHKRMEELPEEISNPEPGDDRVLTELEACVRPMIERLPQPYRKALILSELEGFTQKEIAEKQAISLSGAKSRLQRGREKLKGLMMECCHFEFDRRGGISDYHPKTGGCKIC